MTVKYILYMMYAKTLRTMFPSTANPLGKPLDYIILNMPIAVIGLLWVLIWTCFTKTFTVLSLSEHGEQGVTGNKLQPTSGSNKST